MNGKKLACVVLLIFVGIIAYFGQIMHQKAAMKVADAEAAETAATNAQGELSIAEISVEKARAESQDLMKFLESWRPHADRFQTQMEVESAVQSSLRGTGLLILSQKFESRDNKTNLLVPKVIKAALVIEDEYAKALNWIGDLERRIPLTRVMSCNITGGETGRLVHAEISFEVPIINLNAELNTGAKNAKNTKKKAA